MCDTSFTYFHILSKHKLHIPESGPEEKFRCLIESSIQNVCEERKEEGEDGRRRERGWSWRWPLVKVEISGQGLAQVST